MTARIPVPVNEHSLCVYVAWLHGQGLAPQTIKSYLSAVRYVQIACNLGDPNIATMPRLEYVLKGVKVERARQLPGAKRTRLPITPAILLKLKAVWTEKNADADSCMLWAAACVCFFGFFRSGEITVPSTNSYDAGVHLSMADLAVDNATTPKVLRLRLKSSKTDPFRLGVNVFMGRTGEAICPVTAMLTYLAIRGTDNGPLFRLRGGNPLTKPAFVSSVRGALARAGLDPTKYAGHSFRIGAATTAAAAGIEDSLIQTLGRWKSSAYLLYVKVPRDRLAGLSTTLAKAGHTEG